MKTLAAFFRLIRLRNLLFIAVSQLLFFYFLPQACGYLTHQSAILFMPSDISAFYWMLSASIIIGASGYIINDYFDIHIDMINKPAAMVLEKMIKRRWAILLHFLLSCLGIFCSFMASKLTGQWLILIGNIISVMLLWFYSTHFKKMLLTGNVVIALLTAWVFVVMYFLISGVYLPILSVYIKSQIFQSLLFKVVIAYASFAFMLTLIREVVKDIEDMNGDAGEKCRTMPIVWGIPASKIYAAVWIVVCSTAVTIIGIYLFMLGWWFVTIYLILLIAFPMLRILWKLKQAKEITHYTIISRELKFIMLMGILTMVFFKFIQ
jgi:4-hydroxybenzoate polyprenyltransferase